LFLFGIKTNRIGFVKYLLDLDIGLQDFSRSSIKLLETALESHSSEMVKLVLSTDPNLRSKRHAIWSNYDICFVLTLDIAQLLVKAGANISAKQVSTRKTAGYHLKQRSAFATLS
jgi:hypothetical protein